MYLALIPINAGALWVLAGFYELLGTKRQQLQYDVIRVDDVIRIS